jgi:hypothetical protein
MLRKKLSYLNLVSQNAQIEESMIRFAKLFFKSRLVYLETISQRKSFSRLTLREVFSEKILLALAAWKLHSWMVPFRHLPIKAERYINLKVTTRFRFPLLPKNCITDMCRNEKLSVPKWISMSPTSHAFSRIIFPDGNVINFALDHPLNCLSSTFERKMYFDKVTRETPGFRRANFRETSQAKIIKCGEINLSYRTSRPS